MFRSCKTVVGDRSSEKIRSEEEEGSATLCVSLDGLVECTVQDGVRYPKWIPKAGWWVQSQSAPQKWKPSRKGEALVSAGQVETPLTPLSRSDRHSKVSRPNKRP